MHDWDELEAICARDGYRIKSVTEDPATGVRRVEVERIGVDPKTGAPVTGTIKKTIYPKDLPPAQIDEAGDLALKSAINKEPGSKLDAYGSKLRADGSPADGFFEATVTVGTPPRSVKIQGWFKEASDGTKVITSHAPAFDKSWPKVAPKDYCYARYNESVGPSKAIRAPRSRCCHVLGLVVKAIDVGWLDSDELRELISHLRDHRDFGVEELLFAHVGERLRVSFLDDKASCSPAVMIVALTALTAVAAPNSDGA